MLVEINSYSLHQGIVTFYCTECEDAFNKDREFPKEMMFAFDTHNKNQTRYLMIWLKRQKRVQVLKDEQPTWEDVLTAVLGTVVNVQWDRYRVFE